jgi:hypothetical protein
MAKRSTPDLSLADLERLRDRRRRELKKLLKLRDRLNRRVQELESRIQTLGGGAGRGISGRAKNSVSLMDAIEAALKSSSKPLGVGTIMEKVLGSGYRSSSANFRGIVNQTLIKGKQFHSSARGVYGLKK